jgi:hypothetical protein
MPTKEKTLTDADRTTLKAIMDRLVPAVDDLPGAGSMGLAQEAERIAGKVPRLQESAVKVLGAVSVDMRSHARGGFQALGPESQDESIREVESTIPADFANFLEMVYLAYYSDSRVHRRIGWHGRPPQPAGYQMAQFDEAILENVRKRQPFWRKA